MAFLQRSATSVGPFEQQLITAIDRHGGPRNWHAHFCRAGTLDRVYLHGFDINPLRAASELPLIAKQHLMGELHHGVAYQDAKDLKRRMTECLIDMLRQRAQSVVSFIDASPDIGLTAIRAAAEIRKKFAKRIRLLIAAHPIFGFKDDPDFPRTRWDVFEEACQTADIIGALPEKDDRPDSIGYDTHLARTLKLAIKLGKPYHIHVDQANDPTECGAETLVEAVRWLGAPRVAGAGDEPTVWAIHVISPSAYDESRFRRLVEGFVRYRLGVIVCPSAAISMRQKRDVIAPTHNSIARVLEFAAAGVPVRLGTDNLSDVFVPPYVSLLDEARLLANVLRFYDIPTIAKFAAGVKLNATNIGTIRRHLAN